MSQNKAVRILTSGTAHIADVPYPTLPADDYIIVKTTAVAINPTDWKHVEFASNVGAGTSYIGCDYAGTVVEVGPAVTKKFNKGDRITGPVNGANGIRESDGTFANYIAVKGDLQIHTPDNITDEEAATLGIAITTIGQGLYQSLKLSLPTNPIKEATPILIYGGSTAMGVTAIQFAKLSGYTVIATSSPHNFDYLKELGADHVFNYKSPTVSEDIRALTNNKLKVAFDCLSTTETKIISAKALSTEGGKISSLLPEPFDPIAAGTPNVVDEFTIYYSAFNEPFMYVSRSEPVPENYEFAKTFWELSRELLEQGKVKPIRVILNRGGKGLEGTLVGMQELKEGKVSAGKLVYTF